MSRLGIAAQDRDMRVLTFDCECRPLAWYGGDFVTKQPTAIAWRTVGGKRTYVRLIGLSDRSSKVLEEEREMIEAFREAYNAAEVVTGHYIRGFDLPLLDGALMRLGGAPLGEKLVQDTKIDLARAHGLSKSQENLGAMFELDHPKYPMNTAAWAAANMLLPVGIKLTKQRVVADVEQHEELRLTMLARGLLRRPSLWSAEAGASVGKYHA
jgi:DNA polymerase elongation subunit (family B)